MKKFILITILIIISVCGVEAQIQKGMGFGVRAGANFADYTGSRGDFRAGFTGGVWTDLYLTKRWALDLTLDYSSQGSANVVTPGTTFGRVTHIMEYVQMKFGVKYHLVAGFNVFMAAQGGYMFNAASKITNQDGSHTREAIQGDIKRWDAAIVAGVGYSFRWGLDFKAEYARGFIPVFKDAANYNSVYRVTVGWRFNVKTDK